MSRMWSSISALLFFAQLAPCPVSAKRGGTIHPRRDEILSWDCLSIRHNACVKPCLKFQSHFQNLHGNGGTFSKPSLDNQCCYIRT